ncbi:unnamed protein product [Chrysoparadoxa australica]
MRERPSRLEAYRRLQKENTFLLGALREINKSLSSSGEVKAALQAHPPRASHTAEEEAALRIAYKRVNEKLAAVRAENTNLSAKLGSLWRVHEEAASVRSLLNMATAALAEAKREGEALSYGALECEVDPEEAFYKARLSTSGEELRKLKADELGVRKSHAAAAASASKQRKLWLAREEEASCLKAAMSTSQPVMAVRSSAVLQAKDEVKRFKRQISSLRHRKAVEKSSSAAAVRSAQQLVERMSALNNNAREEVKQQEAKLHKLCLKQAELHTQFEKETAWIQNENGTGNGLKPYPTAPVTQLPSRQPQPTRPGVLLTSHQPAGLERQASSPLCT